MNKIIAILLALSILPQTVGVSNAVNTPGTPPTVNGVTQVAYWKFDEGSGATTFDSAGINNGTLVNSPTWTPGQFQYTGDYALNFNGTDQYVDVGNLGSLPSGLATFSIELWYKSTSNSSIDTFFAIYDNNNQVFGLGKNQNLNLFEAGKLTLVANDSSGNGVTAASTSAIANMNDGNWHHIVATANLSTAVATIYFDGIPLNLSYENQTPSTGFSNFGTNIYLGGYHHVSGGFMNGFQYSGDMDNIIIHNQVLDLTTVQNHYQAGIPNAGQDVNIYAIVDPILAFTIDTNNCNLGTLTSASVSYCEVNLTIQNNAAGSTNLYMQDITPGGPGLVGSNSHTIPYYESYEAVTPSTFTALSAGTEGAGWTGSGLNNMAFPGVYLNSNDTGYCAAPNQFTYFTESSCTGGGGTWVPASCASGTAYTDDIGSSLFTASYPISHATMELFQGTINSKLCYYASVSNTTPAGTYSGVTQFTLVSNF